MWKQLFASYYSFTDILVLAFFEFLWPIVLIIARLKSSIIAEHKKLMDVAKNLKQSEVEFKIISNSTGLTIEEIEL
ncbi:MAG: hypothetical protein AAF518_28260 [Spirochaetota bacterium]